MALNILHNLYGAPLLLSLVFFHCAETAPAQSASQIPQKKARKR
jgi:hypothetical protein